MLMPLPLSPSARNLRAEQASLRGILDDLPYCLCAHRSQRCDQVSCPRGEECATNVRQTLHRLLYATLANFTHQDRTMRQHVDDGYFRAHAEEHADLSATITDLISGYARQPEIATTLIGIEALVARLRHHLDIRDAELFALLRD